MTRVDNRKTVLVVAGMHRSGTSLVASLLHRGGCRMGDALLAADHQNRAGYFEDLEFLDLNRRMLKAGTLADQPGHQDWGWTEGIDPSGIPAGLLDPFAAEADALVGRRRVACAAERAWGWKDPRTSVLLDFWDARVPDARYVFVYREPWDVADSIGRLGADVFLRRPDFAHRLWRHYNRLLLDFARRHRDRALIVHAGAVLRDPRRLPALVQSRFDITLDADAIAGTVDPALLTSADERTAALVAAAHPECVDLFRECEAAADLPSARPLPRAPAAADPVDPRIAIVIPCFDQGEFLVEAIASVERVVGVPYELIIVNDGSRDRHTLGVLAVLRRAGYHVIDQDNRGLAHARNRGIRDARCPVVLPLDSDNRLLPGFVDRALDALDRDPSIVAVYGDRREFGARVQHVTVGVPDLDRLLCGNYIDACAVLRRDAWRACGGYDPDMPAQGWEDWDLWLSMLERGFVLHRVGMETFEYRVRPGSMLSAAADVEVVRAVERYVLAKHASLYLDHLRRQVDRLQAVSAMLEGPRAAR